MEFFGILLWLQTAYSIWQFIRDAKFFKIPYIFIHSIISNNFKSGTFTEKEVYFVYNKIFTEEEINPVIKSKMKRLSEEDLKLWETLNGKEYDYIRDSTLKEQRHTQRKESGLIHRNGHLKKIEEDELNFCNVIFSKEITLVNNNIDMLTPNIYILNKLSEKDKLNSIGKGNSIYKAKLGAFIDNTDKEVLDKNFFRMISMIPLILQARDKNLLSAVSSVIIILIDLSSVFTNKLWCISKNKLIGLIKLLIANFKLETREFLHHFLSTVSKKFLYCDIERKKAYLVSPRMILFSNKADGFEGKYGVLESLISDFEPKAWGNFNFKINDRKVNVEFFRSSPTDISMLNERQKNKIGDYDITIRYENIKKESKISYEMLILLINKMTFLDEQNAFVCHSVSGRSLHLSGLEMIINNIIGSKFYIKPNKRKRYIVSDWGIMDEYIKSKVQNRYGIEVYKVLVEHNDKMLSHLEIKERRKILMNLIKTRNSEPKPEEVGNSHWKRYCSDVNIILMKNKSEEGNDVDKYIKRCFVRNPSKTLKELKCEVDVEGEENFRKVFERVSDTVPPENKLFKAIRELKKKEEEMRKGENREEEESNCEGKKKKKKKIETTPLEKKVEQMQKNNKEKRKKKSEGESWKESSYGGCIVMGYMGTSGKERIVGANKDVIKWGDGLNLSLSNMQKTLKRMKTFSVAQDLSQRFWSKLDIKSTIRNNEKEREKEDIKIGNDETKIKNKTFKLSEIKEKIEKITSNKREIYMKNKNEKEDKLKQLKNKRNLENLDTIEEEIKEKEKEMKNKKKNKALVKISPDSQFLPIIKEMKNKGIDGLKNKKKIKLMEMIEKECIDKGIGLKNKYAVLENLKENGILWEKELEGDNGNELNNEEKNTLDSLRNFKRREMEMKNESLYNKEKGEISLEYEEEVKEINSEMKGILKEINNEIPIKYGNIKYLMKKLDRVSTGYEGFEIAGAKRKNKNIRKKKKNNMNKDKTKKKEIGSIERKEEIEKEEEEMKRTEKILEIEKQKKKEREISVSNCCCKSIIEGSIGNAEIMSNEQKKRFSKLLNHLKNEIDPHRNRNKEKSKKNEFEIYNEKFAERVFKTEMEEIEQLNLEENKKFKKELMLEFDKLSLMFSIRSIRKKLYKKFKKEIILEFEKCENKGDRIGIIMRVVKKILKNAVVIGPEEVKEIGAEYSKVFEPELNDMIREIMGSLKEFDSLNFKS